MRPYGQLADLMINALSEFGPMTSYEIGQSLGMTKSEISGVLSRLHRGGPRVARRVYITHYVYDAESSRRYPRAVYKLGDMDDAPKPKRDVKANRRRYEAKVSKQVNSVWMLGMSRDKRREKGMGGLICA